ncbi:MAG: thymidylate kinase [bacterium]|nr:thymidylate kinase [bacterium]
MKKSIFIVIDGTDGSGKTLQAELLREAMEKRGLRVHMADFPRYHEPSSYFVKEMLNGAYGPIENIHPEVASMFYALDRFAAKPELEDALAEGKMVIANRYISANMGHQMGKIKDPQQREDFIKWLYELEYERHGIPRPDRVLFLHVPPEIGSNLVDKKVENREYLQGGEKKDIAEKNLAHQKCAEEAFLYCCEHLDDWTHIKCTENSQILPKETIHNMILNEINKVLSQ